MIFGSMSESLLLTILQKLQELYREIHEGRTDSSSAARSLSSQLNHLTELQRHLEESLHNTPQTTPQRGEATGPAHTGSSSTSYNTYYFGGRGERDEEDGGEDHTPNRSPRGQNLGGALGDALAQVNALKEELGEVEKRNRSLQAHLDESRKRENDPERYRQLEEEVDRLLTELDSEKERSQNEREQQLEEFESLQNQLHETEEKLSDLQRQLDSAVTKDEATSTAEQQEKERLQQELDEAQDTIAGLRGRLDAEESENQRLQSELAELSAPRVKKTPTMTRDMSTLATSSMPDLHEEGTPVKTLSDSWTSPGRSPHMGERPDVRALREKHEEVTRLNQELQRKCQEQLNRSPSSSRPTSAGKTASTTIHWQTRLREQEQSLRKEMMEREENLRSQLRESEARHITKEGEWRGQEAALKRQVIQLEAQLTEAQRNGESVRSKLAEALAESREKDEEIRNLSKSLSEAQEKIIALEEQLDQLLKKKNSAILDLESLIHHLEKELQLALERLEQMKRTLEAIDRARAGSGGDDGLDREMTSLHENVDVLIRQFKAALEEIERSRSRGATTSGVGGASGRGSGQTYRSEYTSTSFRQRDSTSNRTPPSLSDDKLNGSLGSSFSPPSASRQPHSSPQARTSQRTTTTTTTGVSFTSPKDSSTPHTFTRHTTPPHTGTPPRTTSSQFRDSFRNERTTRNSHSSRGAGPDGTPERSQGDDIASSRGRGSGYTHTRITTTSSSSTTRGRDLGEGGASPGARRSSGPHPQGGASSAYPSGGAAHRPSSFSLHSLGDFDTLETRLQKALDSPTLLASDRSFLEELLMYLRQQRRQLDESRRLLEHLESQQQQSEDTDGGSIPASFHIDTALSGTIPSETTPTHQHSSEGGVADLQGHVGPTRVVTTGTQAGVGAGRGGARLDLSSLYEQLLQTHSSLIEARSTLNQQRKPQQQ